MSENGNNLADEKVKESRAYKIAAGKGVLNLPNKLTIARMVMIPVFILFFYLPFTGHYFVALAVFVIASFTDMLDGKIARKYNLVTNLGKFLDPIADKVLVSSALVIILTVPEYFTAYLGDWALIAGGCCVVVIMARELIVSGFRMVAADAGIVIAADKIGKIKTVTQDLCITVMLVEGGLYEIIPSNAAVRAVDYAGLILLAISAVLTLISGINYIIKNIAVLKV